ncbi:formylmethanofuran dehydrogenase [Aquabacterium sp.]|uniref:formylmethanofuran dehydrogenase n=1 Tax=Aquabacterium sp. TaxID=1872578 RepID=UPI002C8A7EAF|nr:formylmethanofuran dehydrogenase [Aquabacterium sp.]HSW08763.1 formylmethanofuran dehydrogenase [Aquabacterium sp.]
MSTVVPPVSPATTGWTCPFCPLLCDDMRLHAAAPGGALALVGGECPRAQAALANFNAAPAQAGPQLNGAACSLDTAIDAAARLLAASRQPLFGGLGTDVAGARALYRLACDTGAICDAAQGASWMQGLRTLQDHGGYSTTLAEVRTRADLIVFIGGLHSALAPRLLLRCGVGEDVVPARHVVVLGGSAADMAALEGIAGVTAEAVPLHDDLFETVALLGALVAGRPLRDAPAGLVALAARLHAARYAVMVGATSALPAQGALIIEGLHRTVAELNRRSRAAVLWIGGGDGAGTVNQVFTWLSGLPLRSRAGPAGLEHDPLRFDALRLLADGAVDSLLWISGFDAGQALPLTSLPRIVLGHPTLQLPPRKPGADTVFIPISTPGIGSAGHLFRTDGSVLLPLFPIYQDALPGAPEVLGRLNQALKVLRAGVPA